MAENVYKPPTGTEQAADVRKLINLTQSMLESRMSLDVLSYKGATDCSSNPNYPAADAGDLYIVSVAGKIGGASGVVVEAGDMFICKTDGTLAGTQAQRGTAWNVVQSNLLGPIPVKATGAEVDTGADDTKFVTPAALEASDYIKEADLPPGGGGPSGLTTGQHVVAASPTTLATDGVKRYVALLTQSGTDAPVATVLENTLGGEVVWQRSDVGFYFAASGFPALFTADKTMMFTGSNYVNGVHIFTGGFNENDEQVELIHLAQDAGTKLFAPTDNDMQYLALEIRVYPPT